MKDPTKNCDYIPGNNSFDNAQDMLTDLHGLQSAYGAVHQLALTTAGVASRLAAYDQAEAVLNLANERLASVVGDFEARLERVMAANQGESPCLSCARWRPQPAATPRTPPKKIGG